MRLLLLLPFLLGFSVPVFADNYCGMPQNTEKLKETTQNGGKSYYGYLVQKDFEPGPGDYYGVFHCDNGTGKGKWEVKDVDCITAIEKYNEETGAMLEVPPDLELCPGPYFPS